MRRILTILPLLFLALSGIAQFGTQHIDTIQTGPPGNGYPNSYLYCLIQTPLDSASPTYHNHAHPVIFFGMGAGETGSGAAGLLVFVQHSAACIPYDIANGTLRAAWLDPRTGDSVYPVIISIQQNTSAAWGVEAYQLDSAIGDVIWHKFPGIVDTNRIYHTGLSAGGEEGWDLPGQWNSVTNAVYKPRYHLAAMVLMSAVINWNSNEGKAGFLNIIKDSVHTWMMGDSSTAGGDIHGIQSAQAADSFHLNSITGTQAAYMSPTFQQFWPGTGHGGWQRYYLPTWDTTINGQTFTQYTWLLQYSRGSLPPPGENVNVNAGSNQNLSPGTVSTTLSGSATTNTGSIVSYQWTQVSGLTVTIGNASSASTIITGLTNGNTYVFQLTAKNTDGYSGSAQVTVTVGSLVGQRIPFNPDAIAYNSGPSIDTPFLALNYLKRDSVGRHLFDQPWLDPKNNPSATPTGSGPAIPINPGEYYGADGLIYWCDYFQTYTLTDVFGYDIFGSDSVYFYTGTPAAPVLYYAGVTSNYNTWLHLTTQATTRYFGIRLKSSQSNYAQIVFYGIPIGSPLSSTPGHPITYTIPTIKAQSGLDQDEPPYIPPVTSGGLGANLREFEAQQWVDANPVGTAIASRQYQLDVNSHNAYTLQYVTPNWGAGVHSYTFAANTTVHMYDTLNQMGIQLMQTFRGFPLYAPTNKAPLDTVLHGSHGDSSVASNYDTYANMFWYIAACLGNGSQTYKSNLTYPTAFNYNVAHYYEGNNETDADGVSYFWQAAAQEAYISAIADGNGNTMGANMGLKNADPAAKLIGPSFYYLDSQSIKGINFFEYWNRPNHDIIEDGNDVHYYPFNNPNPNTGQALSPEKDHFRVKATTFTSWYHKVRPGKKIILGEIGIDRNGASPLAFKITGVDSATAQAWGGFRWWIAISFGGFDWWTWYQRQNDPASDSTTHDGGPNKFNSMGLSYFYQNPTTNVLNLSTFPIYDYFRSFENVMGNYKPDSVVKEDSTSVFIYRFRNATSTDSVIYTINSPTTANDTVYSYKVRVGQPFQTVSVGQFAKGSYWGNFSNQVTDNTGSITLNVTENPTVILSSGQTIVPRTLFIIDENRKKFYKVIN